MRVVAARGVLAAFNAAGVLDAADVHVARRLGRLGGESAEAVLLAAALAVRAVRLGSVCVQLDRWREVGVEDIDVAALPWPGDVVERLRLSPLVVGGPAGSLRPLRLVDSGDGPLLYLERYFRQERTVAEVLDGRSAASPVVPVEAVRAALAAAFPGVPAPDRQRLAAAVAATRRTSVITGGPGTGKTYTVARLLTVLRTVSPDLRVALAAPTGKAAARLAEEVAAHGFALPATTLHRLLGWRPDSTSRFRHDAQNRLPYDVVVVDECSMVSLTMMSRLLEAVRPESRLVLVGDADQLTSVEAGAVLADLVARPAAGPAGPELSQLVPADLVGADVDELAAGVVRLDRGHRFGGGIADLADAVRGGDATTVLDVLRSGRPDVSFHPPSDLAAVEADVTGSGQAVIAAAAAGDVDGALAALAEHRLLCAHRHGPFGVAAWDRRAREWVTGRSVEGPGWYAGQPLLVTANDYDLGVWNGDTGVVLADGDGVIAAFDRPGAPIRLHPSRLVAVQTAYAMTIHRAQGSQYNRVSVVLPDQASALLSRELLYTAVTRAAEQVRVVGTEESVRAAVQRQVLRASGLRRRT